MRVVSWNVRGGGRAGVADVLAHLVPDVAVLVDVRARHVERLRAEASHLGFPFAMTATQGVDGAQAFHGFVSAEARLPRSVAYVTEIGGFTLVGPDDPTTALSDHAALLIEW